MKNKEDLYKIKRKEKVWCWSLPLQKYVSGYITSIGQDEEDRWGDVSYWVHLDNNYSVKYYDVLTKLNYIDRLRFEIRDIDIEINKIETKLEKKYREKEILEDLILELEDD